MVRECIKAADALQPYVRTGAGGNSLYTHRHVFPEPLRSMGRQKLEELGQEALNQGLLVLGSAQGRTTKNLMTYPNGPYTQEGDFIVSGSHVTPG